ncbi:PadR family transcriptional regulator [Mycetocola spongiae]|uniref:PadR family transcriptional regulator n=1 Tax=Mycetocola spongiae TaxID=2859226 RepID=UPI001CF29D74|nr:PadR family transcriptional regulator [Mycetocola spongiae]UCR88455.1 PadR family transcriptional regulator [Mycetocola spongiae]
MTPVFPHGGLRLYLLHLLDEQPRHGYELIRELSTRFGGTYSPSAGTVYPRLSKLESEGLVSRSTEGRKTVYTITPAGREELRARGPELEKIEHGVTESIRALADGVRVEVAGAMKTLRADLAAAAREARAGATRPPAAPAAPAPEAPADPAPDARANAVPEWFLSAGEAADDPGPAPAAGPRDSRALLREAELLINGFRQEARRELRRGAAAGTLSAEVVATLRDGLAALRRGL